MPTILVCDDDPSIRALLQIVLEDVGQVVLASNGREGIELLQKGRPPIDVAVLDVMMPEVDGFGVLRYIRTEHTDPDLPTIMLTARAAEDDHLHAFGYGADAYLTKPFDPEDLSTTLAHVMLRSPGQRAKIRDQERAKSALLRQLERRFT